MTRKRKALAMALALALALGAVGCAGKPGEAEGSVSEPGEQADAPVDSSTLALDRDLFYGICYCAYEAQVWHGRNALEGVAALEELGAKTFRLWMCANYIMEDAQTFKEEPVRIMKDIIADAQGRGIQVIGMNNAWFSGSSDYMATPARNLKEGSNYEKFLLNYEETWYQLAARFPEITIWEIGNEWNNDTFLHPYEYESSGLIYTFTEKANITTDMLYYASKGIHRANPEALTVLGGLIDVYEDGFGNAKNFLGKIYENIESGKWPSGDPDRYFQMAAWHPYNHSGTPGDAWVQRQEDIYQVILEHEGHDKVVLFTELGFSDYGNAETDVEQKVAVTQTLTLIRDKLPFVQSVHWFRLFDEASAASWGGLMETGFGLFTEPDETGAFQLKAKGEGYLEMAGGNGEFVQFQ